MKKNNKPRRPNVLVLERAFGPAASCLKMAGAQPWSVSPYDIELVEAALQTKNLDGLLLSGGGDVDPRLYDEKPHKKTMGVSETRDLSEMFALDEARDRGIPVLGICRGAQMMNVEAGGTLVQHIDGHAGGRHIVNAAKGSNLRTAFRQRSAFVVSLHHQHVGRVALGWKVVAQAPDGTPEAIESNDGRCMGVQFHPELGYGVYSDGIFDWLSKAAYAHAGLPYSVPQQQFAKAAKTVTPRHPSPNGPVTTFWRCRHDMIRFDLEKDYVDHMRYIHTELPHGGARAALAAGPTAEQNAAARSAWGVMDLTAADASGDWLPVDTRGTPANIPMKIGIE